jgi:hypothetical protein
MAVSIRPMRGSRGAQTHGALQVLDRADWLAEKYSHPSAAIPRRRQVWIERERPIDTNETALRSRLRAIVPGRTEELEALAVEMYARGLSRRDIEALFA